MKRGSVLSTGPTIGDALYPTSTTPDLRRGSLVCALGYLVEVSTNGLAERNTPYRCYQRTAAYVKTGARMHIRERSELEGGCVL